jgi:hypothetical protein
MIVHLQRRGKPVATLSLPFAPQEGDRIYLSYRELLAAQPHLDPGEQLNIDALKRLQDLDGTTWEVEGPPTWEMRFHAKGQYDPIYRVPVVHA